MLELLDRLGDASGAGVRVAVVDSGVDGSHPWIGGKLSASYRVVERDGEHQVVEDPQGVDVVGHGTAVASQIRRYAPDAELISLRILDETRTSSSEALLASLRWLHATQQATLVNLSLSTMSEQLALQIGHAVDDLFADDVTCFCARGYHLTGRAYPTYFASTVAVTYSELPLTELVFRERDLIVFDSPGVDVEVAWLKGKTRSVIGSSFSCPLVTGLAARMLSLKPGLTPYELMTLLKAWALRLRESDERPAWLETVALPPG